MIKKDKKKLSKKSSLIISFLFAFLASIIFHFKLGVGFGLQQLMSSGGKGFTYPVMLVLIFVVTFTIAFLFSIEIFKIKIDIKPEDKKKRSFKADIIFLIIDVLMTAGFVSLNWAQISSQSTMLAIAEVAIFFGIIWVIFELFHRFVLLPQKILKFVRDFLIMVCIPMMFLTIVFLGAYQVKYNYPDTFSPAVNNSAIIVGDTMQKAYINVVSILYNIGQSHSDLWIWLPIAAFFGLTIWLIVRTFSKTEKLDEEKDAQELIDESFEEDIKEDGLKKIWRLFKNG